MKKYSRLHPSVWLLAGIRLAFNLNLRMVYPFISVLARGIGVDIGTIALVLSARSVMGVAAAFIAPVADRRSRKTGIAISLLLFLAGTGLMAVAPGLPAFIAAQCLGYLGSFVFQPSVQAYLADTIPYQQRARAVGIIELGWSLSFILGMPFIGMLIANLNWYSPFPLLFGLGAVGLFILWRFIPEAGGQGKASTGMLDSARMVMASLSARAGLLLYLMMGVSGELIYVVFGPWMEQSFGAGIAALGLASAVIGFSELGGETLTATVADRLGKERTVAAALIANSLAALALPWLGRTESGALVGLFLFYLSFELSFVSSMPVLAELLPGARATLVGLNLGLLSIGRGLGDLIAPQLFRASFRANSLAVIGFNLVALLALSRIHIHPAVQKEE